MQMSWLLWMDPRRDWNQKIPQLSWEENQKIGESSQISYQGHRDRAGRSHSKVIGVCFISYFPLLSPGEKKPHLKQLILSQILSSSVFNLGYFSPE